MKKETIQTILIMALAVFLISCGSDNKKNPVTNTITLESESGTNFVGDTLTAIIEGDTGIGEPVITITGGREEEGDTYTITFEDVNKNIKVVAVYSNGTIEYTMSGTVPAPTLTVTLTGDEEGLYANETTMTMTATPGNLADGFEPEISYSWKTGSEPIQGETSTTLAVTGDHVGNTITGTAWLTDYPAATQSKTTEKAVIEPAKECKCEDKAHLGVGENCDCEADEGLCECTLKVYGTLANGVKVYRKGEFEAGKVEAITTIAVNTYSNDLTGPQKASFDDSITEIHIVLGNHNQMLRRGTILELGVDTTAARVRANFQAAEQIPQEVAQAQVAPGKMMPEVMWAKLKGNSLNAFVKVNNFKKGMERNVVKHRRMIARA